MVPKLWLTMYAIPFHVSDWFWYGNSSTLEYEILEEIFLSPSISNKGRALGPNFFSLVILDHTIRHEAYVIWPIWEREWFLTGRLTSSKFWLLSHCCWRDVFSLECSSVWTLQLTVLSSQLFCEVCIHLMLLNMKNIYTVTLLEREMMLDYFDCCGSLHLEKKWLCVMDYFSYVKMFL